MNRKNKGKEAYSPEEKSGTDEGYSQDGKSGTDVRYSQDGKSGTDEGYSQDRKNRMDEAEDVYSPKENWLEQPSRRERMAEELGKLKKMSWGQRIGYLWDYYKIVPVILAALLFLGSLVVTILHNSRMEQVIQTVFFNCDYLQGDTEGLESDFGAYLGGLEKDQELMFDYSMSVDLESMDTASAAAITKLSAYSMDGKLDCMIMPEDIYLDYIERGMFLPLKDVLSEAEQTDWAQALDWRKQPEDQENFIYGVRLDGAGVLERYGLYRDEPVYLAVPENAARTEVTVQLLHFLMGETAPAETEKAVESRHEEGLEKLWKADVRNV